MVVGIPERKQDTPSEDCVLAKQSKASFPVGVTRRGSSCLQLVHMDLYGPMSEESLSADKYFFLLVDDYIR